MVGLVDALAKLWTSEERASQAKAARAAAEHLAATTIATSRTDMTIPIGHHVVAPLGGAPAPA